MNSSSQGISSAVGGVRDGEATADYEVRNAVGTLLYTSPELKLAKAWLTQRAAQWPGAQVNEVVRWKTQRRVFKPVAYLRAVSA